MADKFNDFGFSLVEVLIAFFIAMLASASLYQSMYLLTSRLKLINESTRDVSEVAQLSTVYYAHITKKSKIIGNVHMALNYVDRTVECSSLEYMNLSYYVCPYETYNPANPNLHIRLQRISQVVLKNGMRFLMFE